MEGVQRGGSGERKHHPEIRQGGRVCRRRQEGGCGIKHREVRRRIGKGFSQNKGENSQAGRWESKDSGDIAGKALPGRPDLQKAGSGQRPLRPRRGGLLEAPGCRTPNCTEAGQGNWRKKRAHPPEVVLSQGPRLVLKRGEDPIFSISFPTSWRTPDQREPGSSSPPTSSLKAPILNPFLKRLFFKRASSTDGKLNS